MSISKSEEMVKSIPTILLCYIVTEYIFVHIQMQILSAHLVVNTHKTSFDF